MMKLMFPNKIITLLNFEPTYDKHGNMKPEYKATHHSITNVSVSDFATSDDFMMNKIRYQLRFDFDNKKFATEFLLNEENIYKLSEQQARDYVISGLCHQLMKFPGIDKRVKEEICRHISGSKTLQQGWEQLGFVDKPVASWEIKNAKLQYLDSDGITQAVYADKFGNISQFELTPKEKAAKEIEKKAHQLPGVHEMAMAPCDCGWGLGLARPIFNIIIHLNDSEKWDRNRIADWLDELQDSGQINIEFDPWKDENEYSNQG